jgi:hypothetical protein
MTPPESPAAATTAPLAIPVTSLRAKPWPLIAPDTALWLATGLYGHSCPAAHEVPPDSPATICYEPVPQVGKKVRLPRISEGFEDHPLRPHEGPYAYPHRFGRRTRTLGYLMFVALRRSLGRTRHPWIWLFLRQFLVVAPLIAIAGAAGQALLIAQVMVISSLVRILARGFRFHMWVAAYHVKACPDLDGFGQRRAVDLASTWAAIVETSPILVGGLILWPILASGEGTLLEFTVTTLIAGLVAVFVTLCALPILAAVYENNHPDVRPVLMLSMTVVFAAGMFLYSPSSVLTLPAAAQTVVQCLPWTPWLFLPLSVGTEYPPLWTLAVSGLLTIATCAVLLYLGRGLVLGDPDLVDGDDEDDDDTEGDDTDRTRSRRRS